MAPEKLMEILMQREELIRRELEDPYRYGYEPLVWKLADSQFQIVKEVLVLGGNRGSKSDYAAKRVVQKLVGKPKARGWCFQSSDYNSIEMQQPIIWKYIPFDWKSLKKGQVTNISYTQKNGFTENTAVFPNASQIWFRNYMQDITTIEGGEIDIAWPDELVPEDWLKTLRFRLVTRGGIMIITFTPIEGYNATVKGFLSGAKTLEIAPAPLLGKNEKVPRVQQPVNANARIVYFHTADNPYGGYENIKKTLASSSKSEILCRAYGVPTKAIQNRFPRFTDKVHVIPLDRMPKDGTRYHVVDPCGGRNWFMLWILVDPREWYFVYREWPDQDGYIEGIGLPGPWAEPHGKQMDGQRGPAQSTFGFGLNRYKEEIERLERGTLNGELGTRNAEEIFERRMDSRYGNAQTVGRERPTTLIEECLDVGLDFQPTPGENIDEGIDLINDLLDYDTGKPVSATNSPRLYIAENCKNLIYSLMEWTGVDGKHGACKDPIDVLRYFVLSTPTYLNDQSLRATRTRSY
jgi:hypothetical protein